MKKVLFVVDERVMGGVSILLNDIINSINCNKYQIDILILDDKGTSLMDLPSSVHIINGTKFFNGVDYTIGEVLKMGNIRRIFSKIRLVFLMKTKLIGKRIIKERKKMLLSKYDVEIAFKDGFCALFTSYGNSIRKYHWIHMDYNSFDCTSKYYSLFQERFKVFDKIIAVSTDVLNSFKKKYNVSNTMVIHNLINEKKIIENSNLLKVKYDKKIINFICVGRLHYLKGYDRLIEVVHKLDLEHKFDNAIIRIIGDGEEYLKLEDLIHKYNLENKVLLLGKKDNPYPYVKESDCFIMCSRSEGFGLVMIEALTLHVPVIALNVVSIKNILSDFQDMVYENSLDGLYKGLRNVIDNPNRLKEIKRSLNDYHYDTEEIVNQIESVLDE